MSGQLGDPPAGAAPVPGGGMTLDGSAASSGGLGLAGTEVIASSLRKQKEGKSVQQRWCSLLNDEAEGPRFVYKKTKEDKKVKGILALRGAWITVPEGTSLAFQSASLLRTHKTPQRHARACPLSRADRAFVSATLCRAVSPAVGANAKGRAKRFDFQCPSKELREQWMAAFAGIPGLNMPVTDDELCGLDYDTLEKEDDELETNLVTMASNLGVDQLLGKTQDDMRAYFAALRRQMNDHPFHNWKHVCDVTQMVYTLLRESGIASLLSPLQLVAVFLAAPAHDLDHRGRSNAIELAEGTDIAVKYPGAPLETHHATLALETTASTGLMSELGEESSTVVNECIRRCIMATDMGHHKDIMEEFQASESELLGASHTAADFFSNGEKGMLLLGMLLKASDISNPARPIEVADKWNALVYEEFYAEGDADAAAGRAVNPLHDRANNNIAKSTVGFIGAHLWYHDVVAGNLPTIDSSMRGWPREGWACRYCYPLTVRLTVCGCVLSVCITYRVCCGACVCRAA
jgi:hypothetical protein